MLLLGGKENRLLPPSARKRLFVKICEFVYAAIRKLRAAAFFCSTEFDGFQHKQLFYCAPIQWGRIFSADYERKTSGLYRCRSPPSDFDFAYPLKQIEIGGNTYERNQSAGQLPVLYIGCDC